MFREPTGSRPTEETDVTDATGDSQYKIRGRLAKAGHNDGRVLHTWVTIRAWREILRGAHGE